MIISNNLFMYNIIIRDNKLLWVVIIGVLGICSDVSIKCFLFQLFIGLKVATCVFNKLNMN